MRGLIGKGTFAYIGDIIIYGKTLKEHSENLRNLFERLRLVGLKLNPDKCEFLRPELSHLGHIIATQGIKPNPERIGKVKNYSRPKNPKEMKQFLGLIGYYRKFIKNFSETAKLLTQLLKKEKDFIWTQKQNDSFESIKKTQGKIGLDRPIALASRTLNKAEENYTTTEKELLAIVWAVKHFAYFLYGRKFKIVTDHKPLVWLFNVNDPTSRLLRWRIKLAEYDYEVIYKKVQ